MTNAKPQPTPEEWARIAQSLEEMRDALAGPGQLEVLRRSKSTPHCCQSRRRANVGYWASISSNRTLGPELTFTLGLSNIPTLWFWPFRLTPLTLSQQRISFCANPA